MKSYRFGLRVLSLIPTPILFFISSSLPIYFNNQFELNYQWTLLLPFFYASGLLFLVGLYFKLNITTSPFLCSDNSFIDSTTDPSTDMDEWEKEGGHDARSLVGVVCPTGLDDHSGSLTDPRPPVADYTRV